jgi:hypothetical protein
MAKALVLAEFPIASMVQGDVEGSYVLARCGQCRRLNTLRRHVGALERYQRWLALQGLGGWSYEVPVLLRFLQDEADGGAGSSRLSATVSAVRFAERSGGQPPALAVGGSGLIDSFLKELHLEAALTKGRERLQAPRDVLCVVAGLERLVISEGVARYVRMYAWWLLLKGWGSMRFDDHRGLVPAKMVMGPRGLSARLVRTKTSGPGKRVETLPLFVGKSSYIFEEDWLPVGMGLWDDARTDRDYFLMHPNAARDGVVEVELLYSDARALSRLVLAQAVDAKGEPLLDIVVAAFWTEHGTRANLPS